jgi:hypothetical protein
MSSPVDELGSQDPDRERRAQNEERIRAASLLRALAELWPGRRDSVLGRLQIRGSFALDAGNDKARLHPPKEDCILGQRLRKLADEPASARGTAREALELMRSAFHRCIAAGHFFAGGCSPVATRQTREATARAPIVARAPRPA